MSLKAWNLIIKLLQELPVKQHATKSSCNTFWNILQCMLDAVSTFPVKGKRKIHYLIKSYYANYQTISQYLFWYNFRERREDAHNSAQTINQILNFTAPYFFQFTSLHCVFTLWFYKNLIRMLWYSGLKMPGQKAEHHHQNQACQNTSHKSSPLQALLTGSESTRNIPNIPWNKFKVLTCQEAAPQWSFPRTQQAASRGWLLSGADCLSSPGLPEGQHKLSDKTLNLSLVQCLHISPKRTLEQTFQNGSIGKKTQQPK